MFDVVTDLHWDNGMNGGAPPGVFATMDVSKYRNPEAEVLLVGGDTGERRDQTVEFLNAVATQYRRVVAVWGNHEQNTGPVTFADNVVLLDEVGNRFREGGVAYVGGCPLDDAAFDRVVLEYQRAQVDDVVDRVVLLTHYVPTPRFSKLLGRDVTNKTNRLLDRLTFVRKPTLCVFGHVHLRGEGEVDGMRWVMNPRGYKGKLRDGSYWAAKFKFEP